MKFSKNLLSVVVVASAMSTVAFADPLPNKIVQEAHAIVPVTKTQIITTQEGQEPVRKTQATVLNVKDHGNSISSHDIEKIDNKAHFSKHELAKPEVKKKAVIVPTSKIEQKTKVIKDGVVVAEAKDVTASGVKFQEGQAPEQKSIRVGELNVPTRGSVAKAVVSTDGVPTKAVTVIQPDQ
ncbi:hypothetical protein [Acinetobacter gerneri]|jgi:hypothetical protein|uniref:hypothetical protein n=1 Tax=Acinetobacter gerneri TaxID=202952 RepID=UPI0023F437A7|nr:hypothetical protein [Acinetobacter gerneri]MCH4245050.1 hypothetical protein [Acinetobacter gerneri]